MALEQLRLDIVRAFAQTPYPGDEALVLGDASYDPEYREVAAAFRRQQWRQLSPAFIRRYRDVLPLLSAAAFRYFLPAYLLACTDEGSDLDTAPLNVASSLAARGPSEAAAFTPDEARAVIGYLELCSAPEGPSEAPADACQTAARRALESWRARLGG
jgi:hypothetical protein